MQRSSIASLLISELLGMAASLGGLKEAQRLSEKRQDALDGRLRTLEVALLERQYPPQNSTAIVQPWWKQLLQVLLPHETLTKLLLSLVPRLLFIGAMLGRQIEKGVGWLLHSLW